jgi:hypothetical protein
MKLFKSNYHHHKRVSKVALKVGVEESIVEETLDIMYDYIRMKLDEVDIPKDEILNEEEFDEKFPVILIPSLGFIRPSYKRYKHIMKNKLKKDNKRKQLKQQHEQE